MMMRCLFILCGIFLNLQAGGVPGTIDTSFGTDGIVYLQNLSHVFVGAIPTVILPMPDGSQYVACNVPNSYSFIAKLTNTHILDTSYGMNGISSSTNFGVNSMMMDGQGRLVLSGLYPADPTAWLTRYVAGDSGDLDTTFNNGAGIFHYEWIFNKVVQQTSSRYLVAGQDSTTGFATLWAFTDDGQLDTSFNSSGLNPGIFSISMRTNLYAIATDEYDRIYVAVRRSTGRLVNIFRFSSAGQVDTTFSVRTVLTDVDDDAQIFLVFDASGNIVVAAHTLPSYISVAAVNSDGDMVYPQCNITVPNNPTLTNCIATSDGKILLAGYELDDNQNLMWVAQVTTLEGSYLLDPTFNPSGAYGDIAGIMEFGFQEAATDRNLTSIAMYPNGQISILGTETYESQLGFVSRAYDALGITQEIICQNSKSVGTNDLTFGVLNPPASGIEFLAITRSSSLSGQAAQAIALQNDATILVAINGQVDPEESDAPSAIFLNVFGIDGLLNTDFHGGFAPGQAIVVDSYQDQYVRDMVAFTTTDGIDKALLTGYVTNAALGSNNLLLAQYLLNPTSPGLDQSFGGYNGDPFGIVLATGSSQGFTLGRQSMGRIITCGFDPGNSLGIIQGYTATGLLDESFGVGGYVTQGSTGIYVSCIDSLDRILVAYNDGSGNLVLARILADGSGLDQTFGTDGTFFIPYNDEAAAPLSSNDSFRIVLNQDEEIYVVAVLLNGTVIAVNQIDPNAQSGIINSSSFYAANFGGTLDNFQIGALLINQDHHLVIAGADTGSILVIQIMQVGPTHESYLILDPEFNTAETPGYIRYNINDETQLNTITNGLIHPDGRYLIVGYKPIPPLG